MANLINIPGIGKTSLELLEAAGFQNVESLVKAGVPELARELERANAILKISKRSPGQATIEKWINAARDIMGVPAEPVGPALLPVDYEQSPDVASMLVSAPFAIPLPARHLMDYQLGVADIPAAKLLNCYSGDLDVKADSRLPKNRQSKPPVVANSYVQMANHGGSRMEIDISKMRSIEAMGDSMQLKMAALGPADENDRVALMRAARVSTNLGRDPKSRWYIRGVLHNHPFSIFFGAICTLLLMILTPIAVTSAVLLLASVEYPTRFSWVPKELLAFPLAIPVIGMVYFIWGVSGTCRVCGQKLFVNRSHLKNSRAHHFPGLGHILPLCLHLLCFRWFRCTHCGTPVRLVK